MSSTLADCVTFINGDRGKNYPKQVDFANGEVPFVSASDLSNNSLSNASTYQKKITKSAYEKLRSGKVVKEDILLCLRGSLGKLGVVSDDMTAAIASSLVILRPHNQTNSKFLFQWLKSPDFQQTLASFDNGSVQGNLSVKSISKIAVPDFSPSDQKAIAHILGTLDDKIELNQKMNQTLEEIAKAIFKSWFVDFDPVRAKAEGRPTGLPPEISDLFPDALVDSEIGEIPKGWNVLKVKDEAIRLKVGKLYSNKTVDYEGSIPVLDQSDAGIIGYHSNDEFVSASLENPVFTFANHTCKMRLLFSDFGVIQNVIPIQSKSYPTIWFYLRTLGIKEFEEYKGHIPDFMDTQLCFPSVQLAQSLNQLVTPLFHRIEIANREIGVLSELRDTLLPKLISGELRIPDAEKFLEEAGI